MTNIEKLRQSLKQRQLNVARLSQTMKDFDNGIIPSEIDDRSPYEKHQDFLYVQHELRDKIFKLFGQDEKYSEQFMHLLGTSNVTPGMFNSVYDQLRANFKNTVPTPTTAFGNMNQLIDNFNSSGVASSALVKTDNSDVTNKIENVNELIKNAMDSIEQGFQEQAITISVANDSRQKLEAFKVLTGRLGKLMREPFSDDYEGDKEKGLFAYAKKTNALNDIVKILTSGNGSNHDPMNNLDELISNLEKVKEETFRTWTNNKEKPAKEEEKRKTKAEKAIRKEQKQRNKEQDLEEEYNALIEQGYKKKEINVNNASSTPCKDCGRYYFKGNYRQQGGFGHVQTDAHKQALAGVSIEEVSDNEEDAVASHYKVTYE